MEKEIIKKYELVDVEEVFTTENLNAIKNYIEKYIKLQNITIKKKENAIKILN